MAAPDHPEIPGVCGWMLLQAGVITPLEKPAFLDDEGPSAEIPTFITRTNARERFGMEPGETVPEAIARHNAKEG